MRWLGVLVALLVAHAGAAAKDVPLALFKSFAGNVNFTGTQETLRNRDNSSNPCSISSASTTRSARLTVPSGATVLAAHLYWAGSGKTADYTVTFEGRAVTAPDNRRYSSSTVGGGFDYFGGAADVTAIVAAKRTGDYYFSGLTVAYGKPFCASQAVLGGFSLLVVYSHSAQPFRVLNLFEGFQYVQGNEVKLVASNFEVPKSLSPGMTGRLGHITWEGDASLAYNGEILKFNGDEMTDDYNPSGNQFNSKSNINGDSKSYGIDFDAYDVGYPTIKPGQTTATTIYRTGQDLVLLNAEIIAVPNVPASDLGIRIARNGELIVGRNASYTLSVKNDGPRADAGPIVVRQTLPTGMSYVSGQGTGWSCSAVSQVISCTNAGPLAVGAELPPLTIAALVNAAGAMKTTASVDGTFDNVMANNTVSDSASAVAAPAGSFTYVFTTVPCKVGQQCPRLAGVIAGQEVPLYVTAVGGLDRLPVALDSVAQKVVRMRFALTCENPGSSAPPVDGQREPVRKYAGATLPACTGGSKIPDASAIVAWSPLAELVFDAGVPSARLASGTPQFLYEDVGQLKLSMLDEAWQRFSSDSFVSTPWRLGFAHIRRAVDGVDNPGATDGAGPGFARAGETLRIGVGAALYNNPARFAPNFGREDEDTRPVIRMDVTKPANQDAAEAMADVPQLKGVFTDIGGGIFSGVSFSWPEVGIAQMTPSLGDYLNRGAVDGLPRHVGRFYPGYLKTLLASPFPCQPKMNCPGQEGRAISAAVYSGQPFTVTVSAFGVNGEELKNLRGVYVPASGIRLAAAELPGGSATNPPALKGVFENATIAAVDKAATSITASPAYLLPNPFVATAPRAQNWTAPTPIYIRAWVEEQVSMGAGKPAEKREVSSDRDADSVEDGVMVVSGRMKVANAFGSELLKTPVRLEAQYWAGGAWQLNAGYDDPVELGASGGGYTRCLGKLIKPGAAAPNNCDGDLLKPVSTALAFRLGAGTFWLAAPGKGKQGSVFLQLRRPSWLPSSVGRVVLGTYSSPLIYTRELY